MRKRKPQSLQTRLKKTVKKFKKAIEVKLGRINWGKVGLLALALLLMAALKGTFGPEAQIIAHGIVKLSAYV